jgi:hypothetical protein
MRSTATFGLIDLAVARHHDLALTPDPHVVLASVTGKPPTKLSETLLEFPPLHDSRLHESV